MAVLMSDLFQYIRITETDQSVFRDLIFPSFSPGQPTHQKYY